MRQANSGDSDVDSPMLSAFALSMKLDDRAPELGFEESGPSDRIKTWADGGLYQPSVDNETRISADERQESQGPERQGEYIASGSQQLGERRRERKKFETRVSIRSSVSRYMLIRCTRVKH